MGKEQILSWPVVIPTVVAFEIAGVILIAQPDVANEYGWGLVTAGGIFAVVAIAYHFLRHDVARVKPEVLLRLAELRTDGVSIRNEGMALDKEDKLEPWIKRVDDWTKNVINEIRRMSKHDAEYFKTLNWVPVKNFNCPIINPKHLKTLREHNERIERLERLIQKYDQQNHSM